MGAPKAPAGHFSILYFAAAASFTGKSTEHLLAPVPASQLFAKLEERYPGISKKVLESCAVTVNLEYVDIEADGSVDLPPDSIPVIKEGDEVAIIPPVSSG
jgi:molybdopterin converting factor small subunit